MESFLLTVIPGAVFIFIGYRGLTGKIKHLRKYTVIEIPQWLSKALGIVLIFLGLWFIGSYINHSVLNCSLSFVGCW